MEISGKPNLLKKINKNIVLNAVRENGPISRAKLSRITNISKPTMSNIISSLKKDKVIIKVGLGKTTAGGGKRPVLYKFNKDHGYVIGSQIRINEIVTILTNYDADFLSRTAIKIKDDRDERSVIKKLFESFDLVLEEAGIDKEDLKGIGIGVHGIVDNKNGTLVFAPHFPNWKKDINIAEIVENKYGVKTYIDNDAAMIVCAEKIFGIGKKYENIVVIDTAEGIGAGIIIRNDIYRGNDFIAGEIGHTTINPDGPKCFCGKKGCAEVMVSTRHLKENIKSNILDHKDSVLYVRSNGDKTKIKLKNIFDAFIEGDKFVEGVMDDIINWFVIIIANTILCYNPEIIIITGDYIAASDKFINAIKHKIGKALFPCIGIKPKIVFSKLGKYIGPIGSVSLVLSQMINFSTVWN